MEFFKLNLPGGSHTVAYYDVNNQLKFEPPVYEQRYSTVMRVLEFWEGQFKKVVDFGCAELKMVPLLKQIPNVEHIIADSSFIFKFINSKDFKQNTLLNQILPKEN